MTPFQASDAYPWDKILSLIQNSYAFMERRINPPSSMYKLTADKIAEQAKSSEIWVIEDNNSPIACIFLTPQPDNLYIGKLAVSKSMRGKGLARKLFEVTETRAKTLGFNRLELQTRIELTENHETFAKLGFVKTAEGAHPGFDRPTEITMQKELI